MGVVDLGSSEVVAALSLGVVGFLGGFFKLGDGAFVIVGLQ